MVVLKNGEEVKETLEVEEMNISQLDPSLTQVDQCIGIPIESKTEDKVMGARLSLHCLDHWHSATL